MKKAVHPNTIKARKLRKNQTKEEQKLWSKLKDRKIFKYRFRRQYPIDPYIVDFYCSKTKLVIELDGSQHNDDKDKEYDKRRTKYLERKGLKVSRFWNHEINNHEELKRILDYIWNIIQERVDSLQNGENA